MPYEPRTFPLSDEEYSKMLEVMPDDEHVQLVSEPISPQREEEKFIVSKLDFRNNLGSKLNKIKRETMV